ncbi:EthD family reductase [Flagellimonas sp. CMM7]|uniref:EthD family reductase n=1 Tax=Flagellimonas sp. CMM7 TaxID=2654676 RepID=UPI001F25E170|nr:EthD family reductase [Flagellimonas sp. CMM7]UII81643.1 EthD family reductase [Flagellimonas sp. CMM7]
MKTKILLLILAATALFLSCQRSTAIDASKSKKGMVKVTILYPNGEGKTFDMDYYSNKHMPMVANLLGDSLKLSKIDKGIAGRTPDEAIPYLAIGYLYFDKLSAYQNSFGPNAEKIVGDIPNYTNIQPVVQISEIFQ